MKYLRKVFPGLSTWLIDPEQFLRLGASAEEIVRMVRSFNGYSDAFRAAGDRFEELIR